MNKRKLIPGKQRISRPQRLYALFGTKGKRAPICWCKDDKVGVVVSHDDAAIIQWAIRHQYGSPWEVCVVDMDYFEAMRKDKLEGYWLVTAHGGEEWRAFQ